MKPNRALSWKVPEQRLPNNEYGTRRRCLRLFSSSPSSTLIGYLQRNNDRTLIAITHTIMFFCVLSLLVKPGIAFGGIAYLHSRHPSNSTYMIRSAFFISVYIPVAKFVRWHISGKKWRIKGSDPNKLHLKRRLAPQVSPHGKVPQKSHSRRTATAHPPPRIPCTRYKLDFTFRTSLGSSG